MRRCFQCGANTEPSALTRVGDGEFCPACFASLLGEPRHSEPRHGEPQHGEPQHPLPAETSRAEAEPPKRRAARGGRARCLVCEEPIVVPSSVDFLGGQLCVACGQEMAREIAAATPHSVESNEAAREVAESAVNEPPAWSFTPGALTESCAGCERPMPGPGSYRRIDGKPYCAACLPFYAARASSSGGAEEPVSNIAATSRRPFARQTEAQQTVRPERCDCCLRGLSGKEEELRGFWLCGACRGSDEELALAIAGARHKRTLAGLRRALEDGGADDGG